MHAMLSPLVERAKAARLCRSDLTTDDIIKFGRMLAGAMRGCEPGERQANAQRATSLLFYGIMHRALLGRGPASAARRVIHEHLAGKPAGVHIVGLEITLLEAPTPVDLRQRVVIDA